MYDSEEENENPETEELSPEDQLLDSTAIKDKVVRAEVEAVERLFNGLTRSQVAQYSRKLWNWNN